MRKKTQQFSHKGKLILALFMFKCCTHKYYQRRLQTEVYTCTVQIKEKHGCRKSCLRERKREGESSQKRSKKRVQCLEKKVSPQFFSFLLALWDLKSHVLNIWMFHFMNKNHNFRFMCKLKQKLQAKYREEKKK